MLPKFVVTLCFFIAMCSENYAAVDLHPKVRAVRDRTVTFLGTGYTDIANGLARENTRDLLKPSATIHATPAEAAVMIDTHLLMELYYFSNTEWGVNRARNHRLVYDFLSAMSKTDVLTLSQMEHITILTVFSLAAQEYFWNPKSTIEDLQKRVLCELRCGSFRQPGRLDIRSLVFLKGQTLNALLEKELMAHLLIN